MKCLNRMNNTSFYPKIIIFNFFNISKIERKTNRDKFFYLKTTCIAC